MSTNCSRADLLELARRKQAQIDANNERLAAMHAAASTSSLRQTPTPRRASSSGGADVEQLRADIRRNEHELNVLGAAKRDAHALALAANAQRGRLATLNDETNGREVELRQAATRIHSLRAQRDLMHQRRAAAASAAIAQHRRLNGLQTPTLGCTQQAPRASRRALRPTRQAHRRPLRSSAATATAAAAAKTASLSRPRSK